MRTLTKIKKVLDKVLDAREASILRLRFGLGPDGIPKTLEEAGKVFQLTRERIRQIEMKALAKLQGSAEIKKFPSYLPFFENPVALWLRAETTGGKK